MSDDYIDWEKAARKYNIEIGEKDATIARLTRELEEARGMCDLYVDEFHRIIAIADNSEIKGLCERAVFGIKQRIPLIEQRDNLEAENAALKGDVERLNHAIAHMRWALEESGIDSSAVEQGECLYKKALERTCDCEFDEGGNLVDGCDYHADLRAEVEQLKKELRILYSSNADMFARAEQAEKELAAERGKVEERLYPCADCGKLRTKDEGGTTFTVCDECWDKRMK